MLESHTQQRVMYRFDHVPGELRIQCKPTQFFDVVIGLDGAKSEIGHEERRDDLVYFLSIAPVIDAVATKVSRRRNFDVCLLHDLTACGGFERRVGRVHESSDQPESTFPWLARQQDLTATFHAGAKDSDIHGRQGLRVAIVGGVHHACTPVRGALDFERGQMTVGLPDWYVEGSTS